MLTMKGKDVENVKEENERFPVEYIVEWLKWAAENQKYIFGEYFTIRMNAAADIIKEQRETIEKKGMVTSKIRISYFDPNARIEISQNDYNCKACGGYVGRSDAYCKKCGAKFDEN